MFWAWLPYTVCPNGDSPCHYMEPLGGVNSVGTLTPCTCACPPCALCACQSLDSLAPLVHVLGLAGCICSPMWLPVPTPHVKLSTRSLPLGAQPVWTPCSLTGHGHLPA